VESAELLELVRPWSDPADGQSLKSQELILHLLECSEQPFSRHQYHPGHITSTGMVLHPDGVSVLLIHHKRLNRWLLPGGHVEPEDLSIWHAARREVAEETSVMLDADAKPYIAGFDVHGIPSNGIEPYHLHHDVIVGFQATGAEFQVSEESRAVAWCRPEEFGSYGVPGNVIRAFERRQAAIRRT
jgi:8-oxo-dGTP pyrophosphatase MutT (NUDIX family)